MAVAFDAVGAADGYHTNPSWSHTATGSDLIGIVVHGAYGNSAGFATAVTWGGQSMSLWHSGITYNDGIASIWRTIWVIFSPPTGAQTVSVTQPLGSGYDIANSISYTGVKAVADSPGVGLLGTGVKSVNVTSATGRLVFCGAVVDANSSAPTMTSLSGTQRYNAQISGSERLVMFDQAGQATTTCSGTISDVSGTTESCTMYGLDLIPTTESGVVGAIAAQANRATGSSSTLAVSASHRLNVNGTNVYAVVGVVQSVSSNSSDTTCSVTYGGQNMTQQAIVLGGTSTNRTAVSLYYLQNPPTGTNTITATSGGASTKAAIALSCVVYRAAGTPENYTTGATTGLTVTSSTGAMAFCVTGNGAALSVPTQINRYVAGSSVGGVGDYISAQDSIGAASVVFANTGTATTPESLGFSIPVAVTAVVVTPSGATLSITGAAPKIDSVIRPTAATLSLTGAAPKINNVIRPSGATLSIVGAVPKIDKIVRPTGATLSIVGAVPIVQRPIVVTPSPASISLSGSTPTVSLSHVIVPNDAVLTLTGNTPTVTAAQTFSPEDASLVLSGNAPAVVASQTFSPDDASLTITGSSPTVSAAQTISPDSGELVLSGDVSTVIAAQDFSPNAATAALIGSIPTVTASLTILPDAGTLTLTGHAPDVLVTDHKVIQVTGATLTLTGSVATVVSPQNIVPTAATLSLTVAAPTIVAPQHITPTAASLTLTGSVPSISAPIIPVGATITLIGSFPDVIAEGNLSPSPTGASLTLSGSAPAVSVPIVVTPTAATLSLTGSTPTVLTPRLITPGAALFSLSGSTPTVFNPCTVVPSEAVLSLIGSTLTLVCPETIQPNEAALTLTTFDPIVTAIGTQTIVPSPATLTLTGSVTQVILPITPNGALLILTGYAPEVEAVGTINVSPIAASFTLSGSAPILRSVLRPAATVLMLNGYAPFVNAGSVIVIPLAAALNVSGAIPVIIVAPLQIRTGLWITDADAAIMLLSNVGDSLTLDDEEVPGIESNNVGASLVLHDEVRWT